MPVMFRSLDERDEDQRGRRRVTARVAGCVSPLGRRPGALALPPLPAPPLVDPLEVLLSRHAAPTPPGEQAADIESLWRK
jgi:hypothetical protein